MPCRRFDHHNTERLMNALRALRKRLNCKVVSGDRLYPIRNKFSAFQTDSSHGSDRRGFFPRTKTDGSATSRHFAVENFATLKKK